jgi:hypothetical protein
VSVSSIGEVRCTGIDGQTPTRQRMVRSEKSEDRLSNDQLRSRLVCGFYRY